MKTIDEGFISRVYRTSIIVWAFGVFVCLAVSGWSAAVGWTVGSAMSMGVLRGLELVVRRYFAPGAMDAKRILAKFYSAKLLAFLTIITGVLLLGGRNLALIAAFCAGIVLTQAVIVLKVLGMLASDRKL